MTNKHKWKLRPENLDDPVQVLTDFGLSDKICEKMYEHGYRKISDITTLTEKQFYSWANMGPASINELRQILINYLETIEQ